VRAIYPRLRWVTALGLRRSCTNSIAKFDHVALGVIGEVVDQLDQVPSDVGEFAPAEPIEFGAVSVGEVGRGIAECSSGSPVQARATIWVRNTARGWSRSPSKSSQASFARPVPVAEEAL
jgi:hypothetical protein